MGALAFATELGFLWSRAGGGGGGPAGVGGGGGGGGEGTDEEEPGGEAGLFSSAAVDLLICSSSLAASDLVCEHKHSDHSSDVSVLQTNSSCWALISYLFLSVHCVSLLFIST